MRESCWYLVKRNNSSHNSQRFLKSHFIDHVFFSVMQQLNINMIVCDKYLEFNQCHLNHNNDESQAMKNLGKLSSESKV